MKSIEDGRDKNNSCHTQCQFSKHRKKMQKKNKKNKKFTNVLDYNKYMMGVDLVDQFLSYYPIYRKTIK